MVILAGQIGKEIKLALYSHEYNEENKRTIIKLPALAKSPSISTEECKGKREDGKDTLQGVIDKFLKDEYYGKEYEDVDEKERKIFGACFGIAGPIEEDENNKNNKIATVTRDKWTVEFNQESWQKELPCPDLPIAFINDMVAIGNSLLLGEEKELELLYQGDKQSAGEDRQCIMLVSDGLGQALWQWSNSEKVLFPTSSEGGHSRFAPQTDQEWELCKYFKQEIKNELIKKRNEKQEEKGSLLDDKDFQENPGLDINEETSLDLIKVRFENVLSRQGLVTIYKFIQNPSEKGDPSLNQLVYQAPNDPSKIVQEIIQRATGTINDPDNLCKSALNLFLKIWGARASDLGITYESKGGIFIGGIFSEFEKIKEPLIKSFLEQEIKNSRNYQNNTNIPVKAFKEQDIVLLGAARYAVDADFVMSGKWAYKRMNR